MIADVDAVVAQAGAQLRGGALGHAREVAVRRWAGQAVDGVHHGAGLEQRFGLGQADAPGAARDDDDAVFEAEFAEEGAAVPLDSGLVE